MRSDLNYGGKMNKEIRVLEVNINDIGQGGAWAFIKNVMNATTKDIKSNVVFDFFTLEPFENSSNISFVEDNGGKIIVKHTSNKFLRQIKTYFDLRSVLKQKHYDIVHIHSDVAFKMFVEGCAAKREKVPHIIMHSHCAGIDRGHRIIKAIAHNICKPFLGYIGTEFFACSNKAARWMYKKNICKKVRVINNAVDCESFAYNQSIRNEYRKLFGIKDNEILIGHVGRFMFQKNHEYLINIFNEFHRKVPESKLMLIGEGELESDVKKQTKELGIDNCVIFAGIRKDVNKCMQAMDLFLLPSRFEGLPVVGIEAQAAGLPCLMADTITKETDLFGLVYFMSLNQDTELWAEKMIEVLNKVKRQNTYHKMVESGYDISLNKESLKEIYVNVINR